MISEFAVIRSSGIWIVGERLKEGGIIRASDIFTRTMSARRRISGGKDGMISRFGV